MIKIVFVPKNYIEHYMSAPREDFKQTATQEVLVSIDKDYGKVDSNEYGFSVATDIFDTIKNDLDYLDPIIENADRVLKSRTGAKTPKDIFLSGDEYNMEYKAKFIEFIPRYGALVVHAAGINDRKDKIATF